MRKYFCFVLVLLAGLLIAQTDLDLSKPLPVDPELKIGTLSNGLTYYIKVNKKPEKRAELRLVVNAGSVQEDDDQQGLAHFTEHMAFNGTKHFPKSQLVDYLSSIGMGYAAGLNAGTGRDQTVYQLTIPTDNQEQFKKAFLILSDWAHDITFDQDELDRERGVIIEELRMRQGAYERMDNKTSKVLWAGSKYAERMPIGKLEVLQNFTRETIIRFYDDWYRPDLQAVIAVGDFDAKQVENLIVEHFGKIPAKANPRENVLFPVPDHEEPKAVIATDKEATETDVQIAWKHNRIITKTFSDYRNNAITNLYTQLLNMRLQELSQKADPPFSYAGNYHFNMIRSKSTYTMEAYVPENGIIKGLETLLAEAERVNRFGFTESELVRAKQIIIRNSERLLAEKDKQESRNLVWRYVGNFINETPVMSVEQNVILNKVLYNGITLNEVNAKIRELITDRNMVIALNGPDKEGLAIPSETDLLNLYRQIDTQELTAYVDKVSEEELFNSNLKPGKVVATKKYKKPAIKQWKLNNGLTVLFKQTDFKNDEILLRAFSPGGTSLYELNDLYEAQNAADIVTSAGLAGFDKTALTKKLAGKIADVEPFIWDSQEGFNANCSVKDMETMFQLIYLYATAPRLDEESFSNWIAKQHTWMQNSALDPQNSFFDSLTVFFTGNNPRNRKMKPEDLPSLDMQRVLQIYKDRFADFTDFTFVIVGSFDEKQLKNLCTKYLANLPAKGIKESFRDTGGRFTKGKQNFNVYLGQDEKSTVFFTVAEYMQTDRNTSFELNSLSYLIDEKLRENIREARSGVYYIGTWTESNDYPVQHIAVHGYMQCAPERVDELSLATYQTLDSLKAGLFDEKYVNVVKMTLQKRFETSIRENRWWLDNIAVQTRKGYPINELLADRNPQNRITYKTLKDAAIKYLLHDVNLLSGVLYPAVLKP